MISRLGWIVLTVVTAFALGVLTPVSSGAATPAPAGPLKLELTGFVDTLTCGQDIQKDDRATGTLSMRFQCFGKSPVVVWGFKLSPQVRALIGSDNEPVVEEGMLWFRNGARAGQNSEHRADRTYFFHGTLNPVGVNERVDYQNFFRFTTSNGRKGTLAVAGTLHLRP